MENHSLKILRHSHYYSTEFLSTSIVIQVLLTPYPEADSLSWQSNSWLCINSKWFSSNWTRTFVPYKEGINVSAARDVNLWPRLFETSTVQEGVFQYTQFTHREEEIQGLKMQRTLRAEGQSTEGWSRWEMKVFHLFDEWWRKIRFENKRQVSNLTVCPLRSILWEWK